MENLFVQFLCHDYLVYCQNVKRLFSASAFTFVKTIIRDPRLWWLKMSVLSCNLILPWFCGISLLLKNDDGVIFMIHSQCSCLYVAWMLHKKEKKNGNAIMPLWWWWAQFEKKVQWQVACMRSIQNLQCIYRYVHASFSTFEIQLLFFIFLPVEVHARLEWDGCWCEQCTLHTISNDKTRAFSFRHYYRTDVHC